jgi:hypothetical protein
MNQFHDALEDDVQELSCLDESFVFDDIIVLDKSTSSECGVDIEHKGQTDIEVLQQINL